MKTILLSLAALSLSAAVAYAQTTPDYAAVDANADASATWEELQVAWPDLTQEQFTAADADASGGLSAEEYATLAVTPAP